MISYFPFNTVRQIIFLKIFRKLSWRHLAVQLSAISFFLYYTFSSVYLITNNGNKIRNINSENLNSDLTKTKVLRWLDEGNHKVSHSVSFGHLLCSKIVIYIALQSNLIDLIRAPMYHKYSPWSMQYK